jgi:hypothetical protein
MKNAYLVFIGILLTLLAGGEVWLVNHAFEDPMNTGYAHLAVAALIPFATAFMGAAVRE